MLLYAGHSRLTVLLSYDGIVLKNRDVIPPYHKRAVLRLQTSGSLAPPLFRKTKNPNWRHIFILSGERTLDPSVWKTNLERATCCLGPSKLQEHGIMIPWYYGTIVRCYHGTTVPWHDGTIVPWYVHGCDLHLLAKTLILHENLLARHLDIYADTRV